MTDAQQTIASPFDIEGHGIHTGEAVRTTIRPAPEDSGVRFRRVDLEGCPEIRATTDAVHSVEWETALRSGEAIVRAVEHVLAAVHGLGIDNVVIDVDGPEPPALDGSAAPWCERLLAAGIVEQGVQARRVSLDTPLHVEAGDATYTILPYDGYRVSGGIDFAHPAIGRQYASVEIVPESFCAEIAGARTFGLASWKTDLQERGLALGTSIDNTVVLAEDRLEDGCELRYPDEFVRHKILDVVGDLSLVGARLSCHVVAERPGHRGNVAVATRLRERLKGEEGSGLNITEILEFLPHRYPMLLVDRVLDIEKGRRIVGIKNVTINEPFFSGHFPGNPIMPGVLIIEALAQCGGLLLMSEIENHQDKVVYFMSLDDVKFRRPVTPGDQLRLELEVLRLRGRVCKLKGVALVEGKVVAEATITAQIADR